MPAFPVRAEVMMTIEPSKNRRLAAWLPLLTVRRRPARLPLPLGEGWGEGT